MKKAKTVPFIDRVFRGYGEEFFGKKAMDFITDDQVQEARCFAFAEAGNLIKEYGQEIVDECKGNKGLVCELFFNYIFGNFM